MLTIVSEFPLGEIKIKQTEGREGMTSDGTFNSIGKQYNTSYGTIEYSLKKIMVKLSNNNSVYKSFEKRRLL